MKEKKYQLEDGVVFRDYGEFGLVINVPEGSTIALNSSASKILKLIEKKIALKDLLSRIKKSHKNINSQDIKTILKQFEKKKIIKV